MYDGKTILLLGEKFKFFTARQHTVAELCDSQELHRSVASGTSYLFLGLLEDTTCSTLFQQAVFRIPDRCARALLDLPSSARFPNADVLASAISQQKRNANDSTTMFVLPIRRRWYHFRGPNAERQARAAARKLRKKLPQIRCLITTAKAPSNSSSRDTKGTQPDFGQMLVLLGADRNIPLKATEKAGSQGKKLDAFEKYTVVASLATTQRAGLIWSDATPEEEEFSFVTDSAICSLSTDCVNELAIHAYSAFQKDSTGLTATTGDDANDHLRIHLPTLAAILLYPTAPARIPRAVTEVLSYCLAACRPQSKTQIVAEVCILNGPSRKKLGEHLKNIVDTLLQEKGFGQEKLAGFHQQVDNIHSRRYRAKRNTYEFIVQRASKLSRMSDHGFVHAKKSASDMVPDSVVCLADQWDAGFSAIQANSTRIRGKEEQARSTLGQKLVEATGIADNRWVYRWAHFIKYLLTKAQPILR